MTATQWLFVKFYRYMEKNEMKYTNNKYSYNCYLDNGLKKQ